MTDSSTPIQRYSAEQGDRGVLAAMPGVVGYPATAWRNRGLILNFFRRDLFGRFRGTLLGVFWVLVQPLFMFAVYYMVFGILFGPRVGDQGPDPTFAVYLFAGIIAWNAFFEATARSTMSVLENGNLVKKVAFPCELLPIPVSMVSTIVYLVGAIVLLAIGIPLGWLHITERERDVLVVHIAFTLGFSLILANLQVFMRDVTHLYGVVGLAWMFCTPIFWPMHLLQDKLGPDIAAAFKLNPFYPLVQAHRQVLGLDFQVAVAAPGTEQGWAWAPIVPDPFWQNLGFAALWAALFMTIGYGSFVASKHKYADLV